MNKEQLAAQMGLLILKGLLAECEPKDRAEIEEAGHVIRDVVAKYGDNGRVAFSIVMAEMQADGEFNK